MGKSPNWMVLKVHVYVSLLNFHIHVSSELPIIQLPKTSPPRNQDMSRGVRIIIIEARVYCTCMYAIVGIGQPPN